MDTGYSTMHEIEVNRNSHLIDPQLHIWGWEVPIYLFLGGITAGIMIFSALLAMRQPREARSPWSRWIAFLAPALLSVGMLTLLMDLEYKFHVWRFYAAFQITSPMSWGSWILLLIYPATLAIGLASLTHGETEKLLQWKVVRSLGLSGFVAWAHRWTSGKLRLIIWANILLGVGLGVYTGVLLGTLGARAAWNSALLGPLFLVSGFSTGAALMMLFPIKHEERIFVQRWDIAAIVLECVLLFLFVVTLMTGGGEEGRHAATMFLGGGYTALFWSLVVIVGLAVPLLIESIEIVRHRRPTWVAPVMLLVGGLSLRWILVLAGQA
jgi:formate-dependent nitrite reductase membrane component NrfD